MDGGLREFASLPTSVSYILRVDTEYKSKVFPCFLEWPAEMFRFGVFFSCVVEYFTRPFSQHGEKIFAMDRDLNEKQL